MEWISENLGALFGIGATGVLLYLLLGHRLVTYIFSRAKGIHQTDTELIAGQSQLASLRTTERDDARRRCAELEGENEQLAEDLKAETRKVMLREEINSEDRAFIRALLGRLRLKNVDYSDLLKQFKRTE